MSLSPASRRSLAPAEGDALLWTEPAALWTVNRLDIAVKLLYALDHLGRRLPLPFTLDARELYRRHVFHRTGGREPGNSRKLQVDDYERDFRALIDAMALTGFAPRSAVPVSRQGRIVDGAHRLSSALALGLPQLACFSVADVPVYDWDMGWFLHHRFAAHEIAALLHVWVTMNPGKAHLLWVESPTPAICASITRKLYESQRVMAWRELQNVQTPGGHFTGRLFYLEVDTQLDIQLAQLRGLFPALTHWYADGLQAHAFSLQLLPHLGSS